jgi:hypothetical protein
MRPTTWVVAADEPEMAAKIVHPDDVHVQQPTRQQARPTAPAPEQRLRQPRAEQDLAHQDEQRQRQQFLRGQDVPVYCAISLSSGMSRKPNSSMVPVTASARPIHSPARRQAEQDDEHGEDFDFMRASDGSARDGNRYSATDWTGAHAEVLERQAQAGPEEPRDELQRPAEQMPKVTSACGIHTGVPEEMETWSDTKLRQVKIDHRYRRDSSPPKGDAQREKHRLQPAA